MSIRIQTASESGRRMDTFMEIFTLVTGLVYIVLEIRQKNFMWVVGVATSLAAIYTFWSQHLYASMILNVYYFCISFWGLYQWRKDAGKLAAGTVVLTGGNSRESGSGMPDLSGSEAGFGNKPGNGSIGKCNTFPDHAGENVDCGRSCPECCRDLYVEPFLSGAVAAVDCGGHNVHSTLCDPGTVLDGRPVCSVHGFGRIRIYALAEERNICGLNVPGGGYALSAEAGFYME